MQSSLSLFDLCIVGAVAYRAFRLLPTSTPPSGLLFLRPSRPVARSTRIGRRHQPALETYGRSGRRLTRTHSSLGEARGDRICNLAAGIVFDASYRQDAKQAAELHVAHLAGEITRDTAELNSHWCDLHRTDSDAEWQFEAIWQSVQHHLSRAGLYPTGDEQEARLYAEFACHLSTFWLRTYANSDAIPDNVASAVRDLYDEDDFWPIYRAWYDVKAQRPGVVA